MENHPESEGELIFENASGYGRVIFHPEPKCIEIVLLGTLPYQDNIEFYKVALQKATDQQCGNIIFSLQAMISDRVQSRAWIVSKFVPAFFKQIKVEMYRAAVIAPKPNPFVKSGIDFIIKMVGTMGKRVEIRHFNSHSEALAWYQSLPH
ncbi:MAG TPA: hypothetical protein DCE41_37160 [Cytophagales bacterium]|nr:hypothetical protein [Cytophagales bacterium]HAA22812.1 hypothetical protein [Cytophagales bacterium]HAP65313.1 hypothetical protein [Cytophagales bacterium]